MTAMAEGVKRERLEEKKMGNEGEEQICSVMQSQSSWETQEKGKKLFSIIVVVYITVREKPKWVL